MCDEFEVKSSATIISLVKISKCPTLSLIFPLPLPHSKYSCGYFIGKLFEGMDWGTDKVFSQQKQVAESLDVKLDVLPQILKDVVSHVNVLYICIICKTFPDLIKMLLLLILLSQFAIVNPVQFLYIYFYLFVCF